MTMDKKPLPPNFRVTARGVEEVPEEDQRAIFEMLDATIDEMLEILKQRRETNGIS